MSSQATAAPPHLTTEARPLPTRFNPPDSPARVFPTARSAHPSATARPSSPSLALTYPIDVPTPRTPSRHRPSLSTRRPNPPTSPHGPIPPHLTSRRRAMPSLLYPSDNSSPPVVASARPTCHFLTSFAPAPSTTPGAPTRRPSPSASPRPARLTLAASRLGYSFPSRPAAPPRPPQPWPIDNPSPVVPLRPLPTAHPAPSPPRPFPRRPSTAHPHPRPTSQPIATQPYRQPYEPRV
jgi:hypothetical protein